MFSSLSLILDGTLEVTLGTRTAAGNAIPASGTQRISPSAALQAATRTGGEIMQRGHELGLVKEGCLADLLLVDGDPLKDIRVLQDKQRLAFIMKGGVRYVPCEGPRHIGRVH